MSESDTPAPHPQWHDPEPYEPRDCWPRRNWGWEFLRRLPAFDTRWHDTTADFVTAKDTSQLRVVELRTAVSQLNAFGCLYSDAPQIDARTARVLWTADASPRVLPMVAVKAAPGDKDAIFRLERLEIAATLVRAPNDVQHLLLQDGARNLQLLVKGADLRTPVRLYPEPPPRRDTDESYWASLHCWTDFWSSGRLCAKHFPRERRHQRLRFNLLALDGWQAGVPHREIAEAQFGTTRVASEWDDPQGTLRDTLRHAIRRGRDLMAGGYLPFLR